MGLKEQAESFKSFASPSPIKDNMIMSSLEHSGQDERRDTVIYLFRHFVIMEW